jgi:hypothetical protein
MTDKNESILTFFMGPFLIVVGIWTVCFGCLIFHRAKESINWPTTRAEIKDSYVESVKHGYASRVTYEFEVGTTTFTGKHVNFGSSSTKYSSEAQEVVNRYPKGAFVYVYYDPKNPEVCVLEPGNEEQTLYGPAYGLAFIALGIFMMVGLPKLKKTFAPQPSIQDYF